MGMSVSCWSFIKVLYPVPLSVSPWLPITISNSACHSWGEMSAWIMRQTHCSIKITSTRAISSFSHYSLTTFYRQISQINLQNAVVVLFSKSARGFSWSLTIVLEIVSTMYSFCSVSKPLFCILAFGPVTGKTHVLLFHKKRMYFQNCFSFSGERPEASHRNSKTGIQKVDIQSEAPTRPFALKKQQVFGLRVSCSTFM